MIERRPALLLPFCLAVLLHLAGAVCVSRLAGPSPGPEETPARESRLQIRLQPSPPSPAPPSAVPRPAAERSVRADVVPSPPPPVEPPALPVPVAAAARVPTAETPAAPETARGRPRAAPGLTRTAAAIEAPARQAEAAIETAAAPVSGGPAQKPDAPLPPTAAAADTQAWAIDGRITPRYPLLSRLRGEEGRVVVRVSLDAAGRPIEGVVESGSGHDALDRAALNAVRRATWSVRPGTPVPDAATNAIVRVPIDFRLEPAAGPGPERGDR